MITRNLLVALFSVWLVVGCGEEKKSTKKTTKLTPQYGGILKYGKNGPAITLDPAEVTETESSIIVSNIFDPLVQQTPGKSDIEPGLAESWEISPDGKKYTFKLRKGVKFHDGTPFDAEAVVFNFERQSNRRHPFYNSNKFVSWGTLNMDKIYKGIRAIDDHTVEISLLKPDATFLSVLTIDFLSISSPAAVKKHGVNFSQNPSGTGPFKFDSWEEDGKIILSVNDEFWGGKSYVAKVEFIPIPDAHQRWLKLAAGEVDFMDSPHGKDLQSIRSNPEVKLMNSDGINVGYVAMNMNKKPFNDVRVRRAINLAINKLDLVKLVFGDFGRPAKNPMAPSMLGYNNEIRPVPHNPDSAKLLLSAAGYPNGFKTTLWVMPISRPYMPDGKLAGEIMQRELKRVGIEVEIQTYPWEQYLQKLYRGDHEMAMAGWVADVADPDNFFSSLLSKEAAESTPSSNSSFYKSDEMQALIAKGKQTHNSLERRNIYKEACLVFNRDLPYFLTAHGQVMVAMKKQLMDFQFYPSSKRRLNKVWFAAQQ